MLAMMRNELGGGMIGGTEVGDGQGGGVLE